DHRGLAEEARFRREGRLGAGHGAPALERFHQRGLLAQHEAARAAPDLHLDREVAPEHAWADEAPGTRLFHPAADALGRQVRLAAHTATGGAAPGRVGRQARAFEQSVGIALHEMTILEDAGLSLLAVHDDVLGRFLGAAYPFPLEGGGEIGAAPTAQACRLHRL